LKKIVGVAKRGEKRIFTSEKQPAGAGREST